MRFVIMTNLTIVTLDRLGRGQNWGEESKDLRRASGQESAGLSEEFALPALRVFRQV